MKLKQRKPIAGLESQDHIIGHLLQHGIEKGANETQIVVRGLIIQEHPEHDLTLDFKSAFDGTPSGCDPAETGYPRVVKIRSDCQLRAGCFDVTCKVTVRNIVSIVITNIEESQASGASTTTLETVGANT